MINNRRRNFRPRTQKSNFRRRNDSSNSVNGSNYNQGNSNFFRNDLRCFWLNAPQFATITPVGISS